MRAPRSAIGLVVLLSCACGRRGSGGDETPDASSGDCTGAPDFAACTAPEAADAICVSETCVPLPPCGDACASAGPRFALPDTNLRVCFGPSPNGTDGTIPCPGTPGAADCGATAHCGQDAQYGWDTSHAAGTRFSVTSPSGERVVSDEVTGLVWQGCAAGQSAEDCTGEATLSNWFDSVSTCETSTWGGFEDWRLPDSFELQSVGDYGTTSPAMDVTVFVNAPSRFDEDYDQWWIDCVWSSSSYARDPEVAWVLMSNSGDIAEGSGTTYHLNDKAAATWPGCTTRCVRGGPAAPAVQRFLRVEPVAGEPLVADTVTRLVWQGCSYGQTGGACDGTAEMLDWRSGLAACQDLSWGGRDDFRLPNIKELRSLADLERSSPAIDPVAFPHTPFYGIESTEQNAGQYWSSTGRSYNDFALYAEFGTGFTHFFEQPEGRHIRCVRDP